MPRRLLVLALILLPAGALAASASSLGPQPDSAPAASAQTSNILQPAGSSLQPADTNGSVAGSAGTDPLQQPAGADAVKLFIQGDVDSRPQSADGPDLAWLWYLLVTLGAATVLSGAAVLPQGRFRRNY